MAFISSNQGGKQQKLVFILMGVILIAAVVLIVVFWVLPSSPASVSQAETEIERTIRMIDFDKDFLSNKFFEELKVYGQWPLVITEKGRGNPFLPY